MKITKRKLESLINEGLSHSNFSKGPSLVRVYKLGGRPLMLEMADQLRSVLPAAGETYDKISAAQEEMEKFVKGAGPKIDADVKKWHKKTGITPDMVSSSRFQAMAKAVGKDVGYLSRTLELSPKLTKMASELTSMVSDFEKGIQAYSEFRADEKYWKRAPRPKANIEPTLQHAKLEMGEEGATEIKPGKVRSF
jgi:hypothetical protein